MSLVNFLFYVSLFLNLTGTVRSTNAKTADLDAKFSHLLGYRNGHIPDNTDGTVAASDDSHRPPGTVSSQQDVPTGDLILYCNSPLPGKKLVIV